MTVHKINLYGVDLIVEGYYTPAEESELYDNNMTGYPGYPAEFEIRGIYVSDITTDLSPLILWQDTDEIEQLILEKYE